MSEEKKHKHLAKKAVPTATRPTPVKVAAPAPQKKVADEDSGRESKNKEGENAVGKTPSKGGLFKSTSKSKVKRHSAPKPLKKKTSETRGVKKSTSDSGAAAKKELAKSNLEGLIGSAIENTKREKVSISDIAGDNKLIGLYFSAHWCPPCRGFTPLLVKFYKQVKASSHKDKLEIIFVSGDRDKKSYEEYFATMPWLSIPFEQEEKKEDLGDTMGVFGIPTLIFIHGLTGTVVEKNGKSKVSNDLEGKAFPWGLLK